MRVEVHINPSWEGVEHLRKQVEAYRKELKF